MELAGVDTDRSDLGTASMLSEASTEGEGDDEREAGEVAFETGDVSAAVAAIVAVEEIRWWDSVSSLVDVSSQWREWVLCRGRGCGSESAQGYPRAARPLSTPILGGGTADSAAVSWRSRHSKSLGQRRAAACHTPSVRLDVGCCAAAEGGIDMNSTSETLS